MGQVIGNKHIFPLIIHLPQPLYLCQFHISKFPPPRIHFRSTSISSTTLLTSTTLIIIRTIHHSVIKTQQPSPNIPLPTQMPRRTIFRRPHCHRPHLLGPRGKDIPVFQWRLLAVDIEWSFEIETVASTALTCLTGDGCIIFHGVVG